MPVTSISTELEENATASVRLARATPARIPNTLASRFRRKLRALLAKQPPAEDGWKPAGGAVMVIAPHPDDEVIGCGGTVCRHIAAGDAVSVIYLTRGESSRGYPWLAPSEKQTKRMREALNSCAILGVKDTLFLNGADGNLSDPQVMAALQANVVAAVQLHNPRVIYVPHAEDNHADHIAAFRMVMEIAKEMSPAPTVYQYELWSPLYADFAVDISGQMKAKIRAIRCHELALDAFDYVSTMIGLAAYRSGTMLQRKGYAEAFKRTAVSE